MKHTPGPWRYSTEGSQVTTSEVGILEGSKRICFLSTPYKDKEIIEANGKLIAAAPELLANCIATLEDLESGSLKENAETYQMAIENLRYIIKKATI